MMAEQLSQDVTERLVREVIEIADETVREGGIPFSAAVADHSGKILGTGVNTVLKDHDPTAHAEVAAIRDACARHSRTDLAGSVLVCSGEPCAMCYISALFAGVTDVIFALSADEAAAHGYAYGQSYRFLGEFPDRWPMRRLHLPLEGAHTPFLNRR